MNHRSKIVGFIFLALVLNIFAIALNLALSKVLLHITGWTIISTEIFPLIWCGVGLYFILRKGPLSLVWGLVAHSFIYFEALMGIEYLVNVPMISNAVSVPIAVIIAILYLLIIGFALRNLFKYHDRRFLGVLIFFFAINIFTGFCGPYSPNTILTQLFFDVLNLN